MQCPDSLDVFHALVGELDGADESCQGEVSLRVTVQINDLRPLFSLQNNELRPLFSLRFVCTAKTYFKTGG